MKFKTMVVCSTLNQMVNYVPIIEHGIKKVIYITFRNGSNSVYNIKFPYSRWDKNLIEVLQKIDTNIELKELKLEPNEIANHELIKKELKDLINEKESILWNITGGQRHLVMAITEYVSKNRPKDYLLYFEGDEEKYYYYNSEGSLNSEDVENEQDCLLTIPIALKLMGFKINSNLEEKSKEYQKLILKEAEDDSDEYKEYQYYNELYEEYINNDDLVKAFIESNKEKEGLVSLRQIISQINNEKVKKLFSGDNLDILEKSLGNYKKGKVFGYILEKMAFYKMIRTIKESSNCRLAVADIGTSIKIGSEVDGIKGIIDELDIVLLTKKGKLVVFECKSGKMLGDNAKSTGYSTYKISGVYGTPVLIDPLTKDVQLNDPIFKYIKSAETAASMADLLICRMEQDKKIDMNKYKLKDFIVEILGGE